MILSKPSKRVLDPYDRISEVLFGLIMVLTFTGSLSIAEAGRDNVRTMLIGALGCNLAWGIIDAVFYLMGCLAEKGSGLATLRAVRRAKDVGAARRLLGDAVPAPLMAVLSPEELKSIHDRVKELPEPAERANLTNADWAGALGVFLLVFLSTFPVAIPFMVIREAQFALRVSNGVAMAMLFLTGCAFARVTGHRPWVMGVGMVLLGGVLVGLTIALGG